jgi:hypothetical protein
MIVNIAKLIKMEIKDVRHAIQIISHLEEFVLLALSSVRDAQ